MVKKISEILFILLDFGVATPHESLIRHNTHSYQDLSQNYGFGGVYGWGTWPWGLHGDFAGHMSHAVPFKHKEHHTNSHYKNHIYKHKIKKTKLKAR